MNLVFIGAPGSGKGTQSARFVKDGYGHISTGNLLRDEISKESELGLKVKEVMASGHLVSDELVVELLKANLDLGKKSYIFDGYPRNLDQAQILDHEILEKYESKAIYFRVDPDKLVERLTNRRVSKNGKHIYNLLTNPPKVDGICDVTGESLVHRKDDREDVIRERMKVYESTIEPVLSFYKKKGTLVEINAQQSLDEVYSSVKAHL